MHTQVRSLIMNISIIQSTINAINKPVIFINTDYTIRAVNHAYSEAYGKKVKLGKSRCYEVSHNSEQPCDKNGESCPLKECMSTQKSTSVVHVHQTRQGKQFCDILMKPVKGKDGITIGFLEIIENIHFASAEMKKDTIIGHSAVFKQMLKKVSRAAKSDISVLLQGQTGTGKELVARALHDGSERNKKPFVIIECSGLTESLFESELFGHEKGAFTGATQTKQGLVELAEGGTIFFDEIGDVPLNMQVKLLRLLETRSFRAVGSLQSKNTDFRFLSASHKNLLEMVKAGTFREDLYYRIAGFPIHLPSLQERRADIVMLAKYFLSHGEYAKKHFSIEALEVLTDYNFPGNIRELKNIVEQASLLSDENEISINELPDHVTEPIIEAANGDIVKSDVKPLAEPLENKSASTPISFALVTLEQAEKNYLSQAIAQSSLPIDRLADKLGVSLRTLYRKLKKYGLAYTI